MTLLTFLAGVVTGIVAMLVVLVVSAIRYQKRRKELYAKASGLWTKAGEMMETAKIWHAIGDKEVATDAIIEAQRLAKEAEKFEDEADGRQKAP